MRACIKSPTVIMGSAIDRVAMVTDILCQCYMKSWALYVFTDLTMGSTHTEDNTLFQTTVQVGTSITYRFENIHSTMGTGEPIVPWTLSSKT